MEKLVIDELITSFLFDTQKDRNIISRIIYKKINTKK